MKIKMKTVLTSLMKIKPKYIGIWLKDQLNRPDWFHNLVVDRSAWGAFSIYAHIRRSDGIPKIVANKAKAEKFASGMTKKYGHPFTAYKCLFCEGWHVSKIAGADVNGKATEEKVLEKYAVKAHVSQEELDVNRILATGIPDLDQVYGGFRGRTLSSTRQLHAWKTMVESGISQVIDLRADYKLKGLQYNSTLQFKKNTLWAVEKTNYTVACSDRLSAMHWAWVPNS